MAILHPDESIGFHCNLTLKAFMGALEARLKGTGISPTQHKTLAYLIAVGPMSQTDLVDYLSITAASGVRLVDRMERDGWVVRQADAEDGRVKRIVPTDKAFKVWDQQLAVAGQEVLQCAYQGLDPDEIESVKDVLEKIRTNLGG